MIRPLSELTSLRQRFGAFKIPDAAPKMGTPYEVLWAFEIQSSVEQLWPYVADTSRFNRDVGLTARTVTETPDGVLIVRDKIGPFDQEWIEEPWTWVRNQCMSVQRVYQKGFFKLSWSTLALEPAGPGKTIVYTYFGWIPKNFVSRLLLKFGFGSYEPAFTNLFKKIEKFIQAQSENGPVTKLNPYERSTRDIPAATRKRISEIKVELIQKELNRGGINNIVGFVENGDPLDLTRIRLKPLAKKWQIAEKELIRICLHATKLGLLTLTWDVICPHCRGVRKEAGHLGEIPLKSDCNVCKISFDTSTEDSIEVIFHVHPSIRRIPKVEYCAGEPTKKDHIKFQQMIKPGMAATVIPNLYPGRYRMRAIGNQANLVFEIQDSDQEATFSWDGTTQIAQSIKAPKAPIIELKNNERKPKLFVLEELWWDAQALKPKALFAVPEFRILFPDETLSADVKLSLGDQAILFTDIVGSTSFYAKTGDANAFREVKRHFEEVFSEIEKHDGVVVKTIGDAVMAAFPSPKQAFDASLGIQFKFSKDRKDTPIRLRISLHYGPVIAVHLTTGIDYFGSTVNLAAKLQACAEGGQIAFSEIIYKSVRDYTKHMNIAETQLSFKGSPETIPTFVIDTYSAPQALDILPSIPA